MLRTATALIAIALGACSSRAKGTPSGDAGAGDASVDGGVVPGGGLPEVRNLGGAVLASPRAMVVTFAGDANAANVEALAAGLGATDHWRAVTGEYGVGALTAAPPVRLADTAPVSIDSAGVQALLAQKLDGAHELGKPDASTIYALVFPKTTSVTGSLGTGCKDFGGYHAEATIAGVHVPYAVLPTCVSYLGVSGVDSLVASAAHELIEAATNPLTVSSPAFGALDAEHAAWALALGAFEVCDLCAQNSDEFYTEAGSGFVLPRCWSNAAARAGHDPCVPSAGTPYAISLAPAPDTLSVTLAGKTQDAQGIRLALGQSRTVPLTLYADGAPGAWSIALVDESAWAGGAPRLTFSVDPAQGRAGDAVQLTITRKATGPIGVEPFRVESTLSGRKIVAAGVVGD